MSGSLGYLFVDMNAYFASVEQQARPELRGRPVAVVPVETDSTCCIAASYEAKAFGVRTGTNVGEARRMCPDLVVVAARPRLYVEQHHRIVAAVESCLHVDRVVSIDEMACRLMAGEREREAAEALGRRVKEAIARRVGPWVRCSVGIGPSVWIAKVASDMKKPDGLTVIEPDELPRRLYGLELEDLPGIGRRMGERLRHRCGIGSVRRLCELSAEEMSRCWGSRVHGVRWHEQLRGADLGETRTVRRTLGHSHVLAPELRTDEGARSVMIRLMHKAAARLRHEGYRAGRVTCRVSHEGGPAWERGLVLGSCSDTPTLVGAVARLWRERPRLRPKKVSVTLWDLTAAECSTGPLFEGQRKMEALSAAMDRINLMYRADTVYIASMHEGRRAAPGRIAFTKIPDLRLPDRFEDFERGGAAGTSRR